jgi:GNAT superfamily N-acetyltransferase
MTTVTPPRMVPLDPAGARYARSWLGPPRGPGLLALRHAVEFPRPELRGDHATKPHSLLLTRDGDGPLEAFGAGDPEPAIRSLQTLGQAFTLHAPERWQAAVRARLGPVEEHRVETWTARNLAAPAPSVNVRQLSHDDGPAFVETVPSWALRGWVTFSALIAHGAGFVVTTPDRDDFAAVAWVFDQAGAFDSLGVFTMPQFRRLGLGRAVASALVVQIVRDRGKVPLWSTAPGNEPSRALARALGFSLASDEPLLRWAPHN